MKKKENGLFSIGELSQITGINIKALRYYDKVGILIPAWVDPDSGYRYYSASQFSMFCAIYLCTKLDIPMRDVSKYYTDGHISVDRFLDDCSDRCQEKLTELEEIMSTLQRIRKHIQRSDAYLQKTGIVTVDVPARRYITEEVPLSISECDLYKILSGLVRKAQERNLNPGLRPGLLARYHKGKMIQLFAFNNLLSDADGEDILSFPPVRCSVLYLQSSQIHNAPSLFPEQFAANDDMIVLQAHTFPSHFDINAPGYILRCFAQK